jgi:hypothetical protein
LHTRAHAQNAIPLRTVPQRTTFLLKAADATATFTLRNNCFFGNNFETLGLINVAGNDALVDVANNFGARDDANLKCSFIYVAANGGSCVEFDATTCPIDGVVAPPVQQLQPSGVGGGNSKPSAAQQQQRGGPLQMASLFATMGLAMAWHGAARRWIM